MPSWTAACRTPSAKLIFVLPASTKDFNLFGIKSTLSMRLEAKSKNTNTLPNGVISKGASLPQYKASLKVFGTSPVRPQPAAPMLFKYWQSNNEAKNSDSETSTADPLTSKVVMWGKGHWILSRPPMMSILVLVPVNFKTRRLLSTTCKVPVTSVWLRSTSWISGQVPRAATSPAIVVLERCTVSSLVPFNAPRFPVTLLFDRSRTQIVTSAKATKFPLTKVFRRKRLSIAVQLAKTAKSPEILVSLRSNVFRSLSSLKLWLKVPCRSLRPVKLIHRTLHMELYLDRCRQVSFKSKHRWNQVFFECNACNTCAHDLHLLWNSLVFQRKGFVVDSRVDVYFYLRGCIQNLIWITKVYAVCMCVHYICLIYTILDSVISELPRYHHVTPSTSLMSVSSAALSPRSKSTVRRVASSCAHLLFLCAATSRATSCSMMAEEPLPPKSASTTSFRCKDGRSARPRRGCCIIQPQTLDKNMGNMEYRWT